MEVIPIPIYIHFHSFSSPVTSWRLIPVPVGSRDILIPAENSIPPVISSTNSGVNAIC